MRTVIRCDVNSNSAMFDLFSYVFATTYMANLVHRFEVKLRQHSGPHRTEVRLPADLLGHDSVFYSALPCLIRAQIPADCKTTQAERKSRPRRRANHAPIRTRIPKMRRAPPASQSAAANRVG